MNDDVVAKEFAFCEAQTTWRPFCEPDARLIEAMRNVASVSQPQHEGHRFAVRNEVVEQLMYENEYAATLPDSMRHHAAARYRLRRNQLTGAGVLKRTAWATVRAPDVETLRAELEKSCGHACLDVFRAQPQILRNWPVPWLSLAPSSHREWFLKFHADDLQAHIASNTQTKWNVKYKFMWIAACRPALLRLTGCGVSSLMTARRGCATRP